MTPIKCVRYLIFMDTKLVPISHIIDLVDRFGISVSQMATDMYTNKQTKKKLIRIHFLIRKFYSRHHDLVDHYGIMCHKGPRIYSTCRKHFTVLSSFMPYPRVCD